MGRKTSEEIPTGEKQGTKNKTSKSKKVKKDTGAETPVFFAGHLCRRVWIQSEELKKIALKYDMDLSWIELQFEEFFRSNRNDLKHSILLFEEHIGSGEINPNVSL
jgi:hypothetical protein